MTPRRMILGCLALLVGIVVSVLWIDRPLAEGLAKFGLGLDLFSSDPVKWPVMIYLGYVGVALGAGYVIAGWHRPRWVEAAMLAGLALLLGNLLTHDLLKPIFGRTVPSEYLRTGRHGFHWFHGGSRFEAFPSGHSTQAMAMLSVVWAFYPRLRWLCAVLMAVLAMALMLGQWHFLGDILAGSCVGAMAGVVVLAVWRWVCQRWPVLAT